MVTFQRNLLNKIAFILGDYWRILFIPDSGNGGNIAIRYSYVFTITYGESCCWPNTASNSIQQVPKRKMALAAHHQRLSCSAEFISEFISTLFVFMFIYFYINALYKKISPPWTFFVLFRICFEGILLIRIPPKHFGSSGTSYFRWRFLFSPPPTP